jgi:hypothetical protein
MIKLFVEPFKPFGTCVPPSENFPKLNPLSKNYTNTVPPDIK